jgi:hypothetical protein
MNKIICTLLFLSFLNKGIAQEASNINNTCVGLVFFNVKNQDTKINNNLLGLNYYGYTVFGNALIYSELFYTHAINTQPKVSNVSSYFGVKEGLGGVINKGGKINFPLAAYAGYTGLNKDSKLGGEFIIGGVVEVRTFISQKNGLNISFKFDYFPSSKTTAQGISIGYSFFGNKLKE